MRRKKTLSDAIGISGTRQYLVIQLVVRILCDVRRTQDLVPIVFVFAVLFISAASTTVDVSTDGGVARRDSIRKLSIKIDLGILLCEFDSNLSASC